MKNKFISLFAISFIIMSLSGCPAPNNNPQSSVNPSASPSGIPVVTPTEVYTKASILAFMTCVKEKVDPTLKPAIDSYIALVNVSTDAQLALNAPVYKASEDRWFPTTGCKL